MQKIKIGLLESGNCILCPHFAAISLLLYLYSGSIEWHLVT